MAVTTRGRIIKPKNAKEGLALAEKVYQKHLEDGPDSDLKGLDSLDWDVIGPAITVCKGHQRQVEVLKSELEQAYRLRDASYKQIKEIVDASATFLKGKYARNPKKLSSWGYEVDDSPKRKRGKKKPAEQKD